MLGSRHAASVDPETRYYLCNLRPEAMKSPTGFCYADLGTPKTAMRLTLVFVGMYPYPNARIVACLSLVSPWLADESSTCCCRHGRDGLDLLVLLTSLRLSLTRQRCCRFSRNTEPCQYNPCSPPHFGLLVWPLSTGQSLLGLHAVGSVPFPGVACHASPHPGRRSLVMLGH